MGLMGLVAVIFGVMQLGKFPEVSKKAESFKMPGINDGAGIGMGNIVLGVFALIVACFGCLTGHKK